MKQEPWQVYELLESDILGRIKRKFKKLKGVSGGKTNTKHVGLGDSDNRSDSGSNSNPGLSNRKQSRKSSNRGKLK